MRKKKKCGIYCIENLINGKKYIGQSKDIYNRWKEHKQDFKNQKHCNEYFQRSVDKYDISNFKFYIIEECNMEELSDKEMFYIEKYKTTFREYGYNLRVLKDNNNMKFNEEFLELMSDVQPSKPLFQIDLSGNIVNHWNNGCRQASKKLKYSQSSIWQCCNNKMYTYKDYIWIYCEDYYKNFNLQYYLNNRSKKTIVQLDFNLNFIKLWNSAAEISEQLKIDSSSIIKACKHKLASISGYIWEYEDNYLNNNLNLKKPFVRKPVIQYDMSNTFIKLWDSHLGISEILGYGRDNGSIKKCCENQLESAYGYIWQYAD